MGPVINPRTRAILYCIYAHIPAAIPSRQPYQRKFFLFFPIFPIDIVYTLHYNVITVKETTGESRKGNNEMKLIDTKTNEIVADIITNHSMCIDEILNLMDITVNDDGQLVDDNGSEINAFYDDLEMIYE